MSDRIHAAAPFPPGVRVFTTLRHGAGSSAPPFDRFNLGNCRGPEGDDPAVVARNREELVRRFGLPSAPRWLRQVHGTRVVRFGPPPPRPSPAGGGGSGSAGRSGLGGSGIEGSGFGRSGFGRSGFGGSASGDGSRSGGGGDGLLLPPQGGGRLGGGPPSPRPCPAGEGGSGPGWELSALAEEPEADAAVTATPGVVLAILTADCLPVVFAARDGSELAAAHAGWPGLSAGMLEATLAAMRTPPGDLVAWIGPCAGPRRYEVGRNVFAAFTGPDPGAEAAFVPTREGHWLADLPALARRRLVAAGMRATDIHGGDLCTISDPARFFSHRRDGRSGRLATIAWLEPGAR